MSHCKCVDFLTKACRSAYILAVANPEDLGSYSAAVLDNCVYAIQSAVVAFAVKSKLCGSVKAIAAYVLCGCKAI